MNDCIARYLGDAPIGAVLEVGSSSPKADSPFRRLFEDMGWTYHGLDLVAGNNVDIVAADPFAWDLADNTYDAVVSGQMLEHNEMFWLTVLEMARVLKPNGLMIHIAPSRGYEHRAPQDCWRYYRDGMHALATWSGLECVEATTDWSPHDLERLQVRAPKRWRAIPNRGRFADSDWGDTVGVFRKPENWQPAIAMRYMSTLLERLSTARAASPRAAQSASPSRRRSPISGGRG